MDYVKVENALNELEASTLDRLALVNKCDASEMGRGDEVDQASEANEREANLNLQNNLNLKLRQIVSQKKKLVNGDINECSECGADIGERRLLVNPLACLCIDCQEEAERF